MRSKKEVFPTEGFFKAKRKAESLLNDNCSRGISVKFHILYPETLRRAQYNGSMPNPIL